MHLDNGLSGIMRVRNEEKFIESCIESCIESLDELIVVYTGCTDNTENILKRKVLEYPNKLRIFKYDYNVLWFGLNKDEYDHAMNLPDDSPELYCNFCNFALSKVKYKYAVKIDSDQLYFTEELNKWRQACIKGKGLRWKPIFIIGYIFMLYFSIYRRISAINGTPCIRLLPTKFVNFCFPAYVELAKWKLLHEKAVVALSGINVFKDNEWYVPFDGINIHPPYNGEGDTLIFKVSNETFYTRHPSNTSKSELSYSVTEDFHQPCSRIMYAGPAWFHLHANRAHCYEKVKNTKGKNPELFVPIKAFMEMSYIEVHNKMDCKAHSLYQRTLFALIHKVGRYIIKKHLSLLQ